MANTLTDRAERTERHFRISYEDYLREVDASTHSEWVDGEATIFMTASERHQRVFAFLFLVMGMFVRTLKQGVVLSEPLEMKLRGGRSSREPDILVILSENEHRLDGKRLNGPGDLVIEILSPESVARDRHEKFAEYEREGVPEYWIVDGRDDSRGVIAYARTSEGRYEEIAPNPEGRLHSRILPGFWVDAAWLTADELPNEFDALRQILPDRFRA